MENGGGVVNTKHCRLKHIQEMKFFNQDHDIFLNIKTHFSKRQIQNQLQTINQRKGISYSYFLH